ncbi:helix-turn-helix domain-containing protein, partial [Vibrio cholerae]
MKNKSEWPSGLVLTKRLKLRMNTEQQDYNQTETTEQVNQPAIEKVAPGTLLKQKREDLG